VTFIELEWRCGPYFALFHRSFVYDVVLKQLLGLLRDQNLLLIFRDHINTICAIIQRLFWQNKRRQWPPLQTVVAYAHKNDVTMRIAGLWRYGDWRHVATGGTALVGFKFKSYYPDT